MQLSFSDLLWHISQLTSFTIFQGRSCGRPLRLEFNLFMKKRKKKNEWKNNHECLEQDLNLLKSEIMV